MSIIDDEFRRMSPHIVAVQPCRLSHFNDTQELVHSMYWAIVAHEGYYLAGILHGDVSEANIWIVVGERKDGQMISIGVLLDVDRCDESQRYMRAAKSLEDHEDAEVD